MNAFHVSDRLASAITSSIVELVMVNRRFFRRHRIDGRILINQNILNTVDLREFPGNIISGFFQKLYEMIRSQHRDHSMQLPALHCILCSRCDGTHDSAIHQSFFNKLDGNLVNRLQASAMNLRSLGSEVLLYLIKNPDFHQPFQMLVLENLRCPFCALKGGHHDASKHKEWGRFWRYYGNDVDTPNEPMSGENISNYAISTFKFMASQMRESILPNAIWKLPHLRSFLDCLVTLWKIIKLF
jgi:hypothetical protein